MSIEDALRGLKVTLADSVPRFASLIMLIGVVVVPLLVFAIGGRNANIPEQPALAWSFLAIALLLIVAVGGGFLMFRREPAVAKDLSISPRHT